MNQWNPRSWFSSTVIVIHLLISGLRRKNNAHTCSLSCRLLMLSKKRTVEESYIAFLIDKYIANQISIAQSQCRYPNVSFHVVYIEFMCQSKVKLNHVASKLFIERIPAYLDWSIPSIPSFANSPVESCRLSVAHFESMRSAAIHWFRFREHVRPWLIDFLRAADLRGYDTTDTDPALSASTTSSGASA